MLEFERIVKKNVNLSESYWLLYSNLSLWVHYLANHP